MLYDVVAVTAEGTPTQMGRAKGGWGIATQKSVENPEKGTNAPVV